FRRVTELCPTQTDGGFFSQFEHLCPDHGKSLGRQLVFSSSQDNGTERHCVVGPDWRSNRIATFTKTALRDRVAGFPDLLDGLLNPFRRSPLVVKMSRPVRGILAQRLPHVRGKIGKQSPARGRSGNRDLVTQFGRVGLASRAV